MDPAEVETGAARASLELLYHIGRELAAALDLDVLLQRVLYLAAENVGAVNGSILVLNEGGQLMDTAILIGQQVYGHTPGQLQAIFEQGLAGWVARLRIPALILDTNLDERWLRRAEGADEGSDARSAVSAPILARDRLVGVMTLVHSTPGFFQQDHLDLLEAIAGQAGIAILNARLYEESRRQARVMTAIAESAAEINASLDLAGVLQRIVAQTSQALRAEVVFLALIDASRQELEFRASTVRSEDVVGMRMALGQGVAGWVAKEGQGVVVTETTEEPQISQDITHLFGLHARAVASAPIRLNGQVIGILEAINPLSGAFDGDALLVLNGIGGLAGAAIRHAQLFESQRAAHQRYRELFEDNIDPILITGWDGVILEANRQAEITTGLAKLDLQRRNIASLHSIDLGKLGPGFQLLTSGETVSYEAVLKLEGKREVPIQVYARKIQAEGLPYLQWILRDITERKKLDNLREDLISMIYHDLRSPLANIVSSLDVVASTFSPEKDTAIRSLLNIAMRSTERIQRLTDSLLDINRLEAGQAVANSRPAALLSLANYALEAVLPVAHSKGQTISAEVPPDLPLVAVDGDMIRRVLINLLENAIKYTPPEGKIRVGACQDGGFIQAWVEDSGPGIPPAERMHIFDKFSRLNPKGGPRGLGLGLAYCRLAVAGHGGRIWVESEPGEGARFIFTLPVAGEV